MNINDQLTEILKQLYEQTNRKHDCYYQQGQGALFVPEGYALNPRNVILNIPEQQLIFMGMGATFNFSHR